MTAALRCEIFPADLDRTVDFYTRVLGFRLLRDERDEQPAYLYLGRGEVRVGALADPESTRRASRRPPVGVELVLEVDELDEEYARVLATGWTIDEPLTPRPWGLHDFRLLDPDGYYWRITNH